MNDYRKGNGKCQAGANANDEDYIEVHFVMVSNKALKIILLSKTFFQNVFTNVGKVESMRNFEKRNF